MQKYLDYMEAEVELKYVNILKIPLNLYYMLFLVVINKLNIFTID